MLGSSFLAFVYRENARLRRAACDLTLGKMILPETKQ